MIVVTGAAGYVGSFLVRKLAEDERFEDYDIVGIDNFLVGMEENYKLIEANGRVKLMKGDVCDRDFVRDLLKDAEIVYHLAAISGVVQCNKNPYLAFKVNVEGTLNMLEGSVKGNVEYFIYPSSSAVYGNVNGEFATEDIPPRPLNKYGAMKACCENLCIGYYNLHGLGTVVLRFTNIYGVGVYPKWRTVVTNFILKALRGEPLTIHGSGEQRRDFIHIDDVIDIYKLVLTPKAKGEIFNAGSGYTASIKELADIVREIAKADGRKVKIVYTKAREKIERTFGYDMSKIRDLGFRPKYDIRSGVEKTFNDVKRILIEIGFREFQKDIISENSL